MDLVTPLNKKILGKMGVRIVSARPTAFLHYPQAMRFLYFAERCRDVRTLPGSIVECGVAWGEGLLAFAYAEQFHETKRTIWGFDTFEGFPSIDEKDEGVARRGDLRVTEDKVLKYLKLGGIGDPFVDSYIRLVKGDVRHTTKECGIDQIALLHLDLDVYDGYRYALENLYHRVVDGGIVMFDEYRHRRWPGATKAIDEFFGEKTRFFRHDPHADRFYLRKESGLIF